MPKSLASTSSKNTAGERGVVAGWDPAWAVVTLLHLSGPRVRELLAQGCPLDLHPRMFKTGQSAGSVFFKASVWLWQTDDAPVYEMLVRNSFRGYVWLMLEQCGEEVGLVKRVFA